MDKDAGTWCAEGAFGEVEKRCFVEEGGAPTFIAVHKLKRQDTPPEVPLHCPHCTSKLFCVDAVVPFEGMWMSLDLWLIVLLRIAPSTTFSVVGENASQLLLLCNV